MQLKPFESSPGRCDTEVFQNMVLVLRNVQCLLSVEVMESHTQTRNAVGIALIVYTLSGCVHMCTCVYIKNLYCKGKCVTGIL